MFSSIIDQIVDENFIMQDTLFWLIEVTSDR